MKWLHKGDLSTSEMLCTYITLYISLIIGDTLWNGQYNKNNGLPTLWSTADNMASMIHYSQYGQWLTVNISAYLLDFFFLLFWWCDHWDPQALLEHLLPSGCLSFQNSWQTFLIGVMSSQHVIFCSSLVSLLLVSFLQQSQYDQLTTTSIYTY